MSMVTAQFVTSNTLIYISPKTNRASSGRGQDPGIHHHEPQKQTQKHGHKNSVGVGDRHLKQYRLVGGIFPVSKSPQRKKRPYLHTAPDSSQSQNAGADNHLTHSQRKMKLTSQCLQCFHSYSLHTLSRGYREKLENPY